VIVTFVRTCGLQSQSNKGKLSSNEARLHIEHTTSCETFLWQQQIEEEKGASREDHFPSWLLCLGLLGRSSLVGR